MPIAERRSSNKRWFRIPAPSDNVLLVMVACAVLGFHLFVGMMLHRASPGEPRARLDRAIASYGN